MTSTSPGTAPCTTTDPTAVALEVLGRLETAWNEGDGEAFGRAYATGASFVNVRGEHLVGRTAIAAGHTGILTTIYAGSVNRMDLVRAIDVGEGLVVAISVNTLDCPSGPLVGVHQAMSTSTIRVPAGGTGRPQIVSSHNTLLAA